MKPCQGGKHALREISRVELNSTLGEDQVVRWCEECGSIVVDQEIDGRLMGTFQKMEPPRIALEYNRLLVEHNKLLKDTSS